MFTVSRSLVAIACFTCSLTAFGQENSLEELFNSNQEESSGEAAAKADANAEFNDETNAGQWFLEPVTFEDLPFTEYDLDFREWSDASGKFSVIGKFDGLGDGSVWIIRKDNQKRIEVKIEILAPDDAELVKHIKENMKSVQQIYIDKIYEDLEKDTNQLLQLRDELEKLAADEKLEYEDRKAAQLKLIKELWPSGKSSYPVVLTEKASARKRRRPSRRRTTKEPPKSEVVLWPASKPQNAASRDRSLRVTSRTSNSHEFRMAEFQHYYFTGSCFMALGTPKNERLLKEAKASCRMVDVFFPFKVFDADEWDDRKEEEHESDPGLEIFGFSINAYLKNPLSISRLLLGGVSKPPPVPLRAAISDEALRYAVAKQQRIHEAWDSLNDYWFGECSRFPDDFWSYKENLLEDSPISESNWAWDPEALHGQYERPLLKQFDAILADTQNFDFIVPAETYDSVGDLFGREGVDPPSPPFELGKPISARNGRLRRQQFDWIQAVIQQKLPIRSAERKVVRRQWLKTDDSWNYVEFHSVPTETTDEFGRTVLGKDEIVYWCNPFKDELEVIEKRLTEEESAKVRKQLGIE